MESNGAILVEQNLYEMLVLTSVKITIFTSILTSLFSISKQQLGKVNPQLDCGHAE